MEEKREEGREEGGRRGRKGGGRRGRKGGGGERRRQEIGREMEGKCRVVREEGSER